MEQKPGRSREQAMETKEENQRRVVATALQTQDKQHQLLETLTQRRKHSELHRKSPREQHLDTEVVTRQFSIFNQT